MQNRAAAGGTLFHAKAIIVYFTGRGEVKKNFLLNADIPTLSPKLRLILRHFTARSAF